MNLWLWVPLRGTDRQKHARVDRGIIHSNLSPGRQAMRIGLNEFYITPNNFELLSSSTLVLSYSRLTLACSLHVRKETIKIHLQTPVPVLFFDYRARTALCYMLVRHYADLGQEHRPTRASFLCIFAELCWGDFHHCYKS